jgi:soluble lytic murein transglycosylase-like protein
MIERRMMVLGLLALAACGKRREAEERYSGRTPQMDRLVAKYARIYDMPESLLHRVIAAESGYNPRAHHRSYYGLMQIDPRTARTMGFRGSAEDLLDAETNLKYGGKYLRGAWLVGRRNQDRAIKWYRSGYYYEAKRMGLLEETGLRG